MKSKSILILLCAFALPCGASAETKGTAASAAAGQPQSEPLLTTKWSLKQPRLRRASNVEGPQLPPPQRQRKPRPPRAPIMSQPSSVNKQQAAQAISGIVRNRN